MSPRAWPAVVYVCPVCGQIKDSRDERRRGDRKSRTGRWCHAYQDHAEAQGLFDAGRVQMQAVKIAPSVASTSEGGR